jgi:hypothetical protein
MRLIGPHGAGGAAGIEYHFSRARHALSKAARQSTKNSAKIKSGVLEPFSALARLMDVSISLRRLLTLGSLVLAAGGGVPWMAFSFALNVSTLLASWSFLYFLPASMKRTDSTVAFCCSNLKLVNSYLHVTDCLLRMSVRNLAIAISISVDQHAKHFL